MAQKADLLDTLLDSTDVEAFGEPRDWPAIFGVRGVMPLDIVHPRLGIRQQSCAPALAQDWA